MNENAKLIEKFYSAFQQKDYETMASCYHDDIHFSDPVFGDLMGAKAGAMWAMLCKRSRDLRVSFDNIKANDASGSADWDASYTFSTGRKVHNIIQAEFEFKDGKIIRHKDTFDFYRWTRMALGPVGWVLGWSSKLQNKVRGTAAKGLSTYLSKQEA